MAGRRDDLYSNDLEGAEFHEAQYADEDIADEEEEEKQEDMSDSVKIGQVLITSGLIIALMRYGLLPQSWRKKYQRENKSEHRQYVLVEKSEFEKLRKALVPIVEGERKIETNQMRYVHEVYETLVRAGQE